MNVNRKENIMEIVRTLKARIILNNSCDYSKLIDSMIAFRNGCNTVSEYIFNNNFPLNQLTIQKEIYLIRYPQMYTMVKLK